MSKSNYGENLVGNFLYTTGAVTRPTAWFVALHTADPTEVGNVGEVSGGAYVRQSATFGAFVNGASSNTNPIAFPTATANWGVVTYASVWDAQTGGNCLSSGILTAGSGAVNIGTTYTLGVGQVGLTED